MDLEKMTLADLKTMAKEKGIKGYSAMKKPELTEALSASVKDELKSAAAKAENAEKKEKNPVKEKAAVKEKAEPGEKEEKKNSAVKKPVKKETAEKKAEKTEEIIEEKAEEKNKESNKESNKEKRPVSSRRTAAVKQEKAAKKEQAPKNETVPAGNNQNTAPTRTATRVENRENPSSAADGIVPRNYESVGGTTFTRPASQRTAPNQMGEQRSSQIQGEQPRQFAERPVQNQNGQRLQWGMPRTPDGRGAVPARPVRPDAMQNRPVRIEQGQAKPVQPNQPSAAVSGKIVSTGRITSEEREALDPTISPDIEALDSGETKTGILELVDGGYGFIRCDNFLPGENDVYVSPAQIRKFNLKTGDIIEGNTKIKAPTEKFSALLYIKTINGLHPSEAIKRFRFEDMTPVFPYQRLHLETPGCTPAMRIVDLISPVGKGQRGMIVSQPKAGKTTLLKQIASAIKTNYPDIHLIILLIDERPEEVTDMKESIQGSNVEVIYSTFDELPENHKRVSEMVIERAKRLVEHKKDVVVLLDSITRLARAYNLTVTASGRTLSGGLDPAALHMPKKFFGAARCMREGGSLTILATALVETGSRMDDVVFEEFKGTGNMELVLDRNLSERRIFPAIDLPRSSTRREDLLLSPEEVEANNNIRRAFNSSKAEDAVERIINMFAHTRSNREFIEIVRKTKLY